MKLRNDLYPVSLHIRMLLRVVYIATILLLLITPAFAQEKGITIEGDNLTLREAFEQIEAQTSYTIAYNMSRLDTGQKRSLSLHGAEIDEVLTVLLEETGWSYYPEGNHIILVKKKEPERELTRHIRGRVYDKQTRLPIPFAAVMIRDQGTLTDEEGLFEFTDLLPGRYDLKVSCMGYDSFLQNEIILTSGNFTFIEIGLRENPFHLNEVVITSFAKKEQPSNPMVLTGGRMLSVEESSRFAGGFDDPARLVTSLAGVEGSVGDNSVIIHGYAPHLLQWKLEGMEIANPNHFADLTTVGGGLFSALSSEVLGNSDFLTGAYPAEYGNALSGIFDMQLRSGNNQHYQHSIEAGIIGVSVASEGPLSSKKDASYLFHYRNATFALVKNFIPDMEINNFGYQDLSFKLNFPYKERNSLSVWGIALMDKNYEKFEKYPAEWSPEIEKVGVSGNQYMASGGLLHTHYLRSKAFLKTTAGVVYTNNDLRADSLEFLEIPTLNLHNRSYQVDAGTQLNYKISAVHTHQAGINWSFDFYNFFYNLVDPETSQINQSKISGHTGTFSAFSNSLLRLNSQVRVNLGINGQFFLLNRKGAIEPRISMDYSPHPEHVLAFAYGLHSRKERLTTYFIKAGDEFLNKELGFIRAHQLLLSYRWRVSDTKIFKIEPYYHYLFNIPMVSGTPYSTLNGLSFLINVPLTGEGKGTNKGVDFTFEQYFREGYYYLLTASLYDSRYRGKETGWLHTRYNYGFISHLSGGKEWFFGRGKRHMVSSNVKFTLRGGERYTPVNEEESLEKQKLVTEEEQIYKKQFAPKAKVDVTVSYRLSHKRFTHEVAFKALNLTGTREYYRHRFDKATQSVVKDDVKILLPNLSYKVRF